MSDSDLLSPAVRQFLHRLPTVDHLEVLLLLVRESDREWTAGDVADVIFGDTRFTARLLHELVNDDLLVAFPAGRRRDKMSFHFAPAGDKIRSDVNELRTAYNLHPFAVIRAVRTGRPRAIHSFADAFRFRPRDSEEDHG